MQKIEVTPRADLQYVTLNSHVSENSRSNLSPSSLSPPSLSFSLTLSLCLCHFSVSLGLPSFSKSPSQRREKHLPLIEWSSLSPSLVLIRSAFAIVACYTSPLLFASPLQVVSSPPLLWQRCPTQTRIKKKDEDGKKQPARRN